MIHSATTHCWCQLGDRNGVWIPVAEWPLGRAVVGAGVVVGVVETGEVQAP